MQGNTWGGFTALSTYSLLAAGEKKSDPRIVKALDFLKRADIVGIYALGVRSEVWLSLGNNVRHVRLDGVGCPKARIGHGAHRGQHRNVGLHRGLD